MLRDITGNKDPQVRAVIEVLEVLQADILVLAGVDADAEGLTLAALNARLARPYPHLFTAMPNAGRRSGLDLDGNGRLGEARDAQGYGRFSGEGGMAVLSRWPFGAVQDHGALAWKDLPGALLRAGDPGADTRRLSSMVHWVLPVDLPQGQLSLGVFKATPPVFDGPEDLNGRRNHDEIAFWPLLLAGQIGAPPVGPFVLMGGTNQDPNRGEGRKAAIRSLMADPHLLDPRPGHAAGPEVPGRRGDLTTVDWTDVGLGPMRVDYVLPWRGAFVRDSGVLWPKEGPLAETVQRASRHRAIWVDLDPPD